MAQPASAVTVVPVSSFPVADPLDGTEIVPLVQDGETRRTTVADIVSATGTGAVSFTSFLAVALAAGQTNNWAPDLTGISRLEVTAAGAAIVTGLTGGTDGRYMIVTNAGVQDVTIYADNGVDSLAANRFAMNGDALLQAGWSASFVYSAALARWTRVG